MRPATRPWNRGLLATAGKTQKMAEFQGRPVAATLRRFRRIAGSCAITKRGTARHFPHRVAWYHPAYDSYRVYGTCSQK